MAWLTSRFQELATLLILGGLAAALFPALLVRVAAQAGWRPHINAWKGFLALVLGFGVAIIALLAILILGILASVVSLGGLSNAVFGIGLSGLATAFGIFLFAINFGSKLVVAQMGGQALLQRFSPATAEHRYWPVMIGVLAYMLLRLIPLVSPLVGLTVTLVGLGAIWLVLLDKRTSEPSGVVISQ